jgi:nicotinate-nucleotide pyrophosphorylase (carboxylating)
MEFFLHLVADIRHALLMVILSSDEIRRHLQAALAEDIGDGDVTSLATVPEGLTVSAALVAREALVVAGLALAEAAFLERGAGVRVTLLTADGSRANAGQALMRVDGSARAILSAERVALNYLQRLSGVATLTSRYVEAIRGTRARILDTRKTTPGCRRLEKYAVACGGGHNHRAGLFDQILIKDNHLMALRNEKPDAVTAAIARARQAFPNLKVEVEADTLDQVAQALAAGADVILLDNMPPAQLRAAVNLVGGGAQLEASGGILLQTVRTVAETGVDFISVGALTHSAPAMDIGLDFEPAGPAPVAAEKSAPSGRLASPSL